MPVDATFSLLDSEPRGMTVAGLIARLQMLPPAAVVKIFNADSRQFEAVTGMIYGGDEDVIELHSDDIT